MRALSPSTLTTAQGEWFAGTHQAQSVFRAGFFMEQAALLRTNEYAIIENFANYTPNERVTELSSKCAPKFHVENFVPLYADILVSFLSKSSPTSYDNYDL